METSHGDIFKHYIRNDIWYYQVTETYKLKIIKRVNEQGFCQLL